MLWRCPYQDDRDYEHLNPCYDDDDDENDCVELGSQVNTFKCDLQKATMKPPAAACFYEEWFLLLQYNMIRSKIRNIQGSKFFLRII